MFKNYLMTAFRNLSRHKGHTFINVIGLGVGMAACILIMLWVQDELSYDRFHTNVDSLYRIEQDQKAADRWYHVLVTPPPLGPALKEELPEIADASRFFAVGEALVRSGDTALYQDGLMFVDPSFLRIFSFPLIEGDVATALNDPSSVVITRETAAKLFGSVDPIGRVLKIHNRIDLTVTGVIENVPANSEIRFSMLRPIELLVKDLEGDNAWHNNNVTTVVQLRPGCSPIELNEKITRLVYTHSPDDPANSSYIPEKGQRNEYTLSSVKNMHLRSYAEYEVESSATQKIWIVGAMALFILLIACINFMNLTTARSALRAREIGLRKIVGGCRRQIAVQILGESLVHAALGMICAWLLVEALLPAFNQVTGKQLTLNILDGGPIALGLPLIVLVTGVIAGSYPALILSRLQPLRILGKASPWGGHGVLFRRILVIAQFSLSILIIVLTLAVTRQTSFMKTTSLGYDKDYVLALELPRDGSSTYTTLRTELASSPYVLGVTGSQSLPTRFGSNTTGFDWEGKTPGQAVPVYFNAVDYAFVETLGMAVRDGRSFDNRFAGDTGRALLINEEMAALMGRDSVVGARVSCEGLGIGDHVVGVLKDFHFHSMGTRIAPLVLNLKPDRVNHALVKLQPRNLTVSVDAVRSIWARVYPQHPFRLRFLDEDVQRMYIEEEKLGAMLTYASLLAVFVACLGLYGLASFLAERRTREIGVRKVLGASVFQVVRLLSREFLLLVAIAFALAAPIAWYFVNGWLEHFAYRVEFGCLAYLMAGFLAASIAMMTVMFHAVKAARANPVESLKYE